MGLWEEAVESNVLFELDGEVVSCLLFCTLTETPVSSDVLVVISHDDVALFCSCCVACLLAKATISGQIALSRAAISGISSLDCCLFNPDSTDLENVLSADNNFGAVQDDPVVS